MKESRQEQGERSWLVKDSVSSGLFCALQAPLQELGILQG